MGNDTATLSVGGNNKKDWKDNLLVKEPDGKLHYLKDSDQSKTSTVSVKEPDSKVFRADSLHTAPIKGDFSPLEPAKSNLGSSADFGFHPDDQQQIDEISKGIPQDDSKKYSIKKIVGRLIEKQNLKFDEDNQKRFTDILFDFFRNRKRVLTVREMLLDLKAGKNKLDSTTVDSILSVVKGIKNKIHNEGGLVVRLEDEKAKVAKEEAKVPEAVQKEIKKIEQEIGSAKDVKVEDEIGKALNEIEEDKKPIVKEEHKEAKPVEVKTKAPDLKPREGFQIPGEEKLVKTPESLPKVSRPVPPVEIKKKIADVVAKPKVESVKKKIDKPKHVLMGPVQELAALSLDNFRRLGDTAEERIKAMTEKIKVLEHDSFTKKAQGIEAWRKSETYKIYLELGLESMHQKKEVKELIADYEKQSKKTLSFEEFESISDLNRKLRF